MSSNNHRCCASACSTCAVSRRGFLSAGMAASALPAASASLFRDPARQQPIRLALKVQSVLVYDLPKRRQATSWRSWGGVQTEQDLAAEKERIGRELATMKASADFPVEILPLATAITPDEAGVLANGDSDVIISYAAGGGLKVLETLAAPGKWNLMFLRHRSGPVYLWYEIAHNRFLRKTVDEFGQPGVDIHDVVVDSHSQILLRLRALAALKNTYGKRIVAIGGPSGWGNGGKTAPDRTRELWKMDIQTEPYQNLAERIKRAKADSALVKRCHANAEKYLQQKDVTLETSREFVQNAFVLTEVFRDLLDEAKTDALTINSCMGTIMPMSETTACLPLSLLNDDGYMAFCESDFVVIPSGVLLHYICGKPVFLNDPTHPHDGVVTIAHCTAPRKLDGQNDEPVRVLTHFESDYGAAPKVAMRKGQKVTNLIPDFASRRWVGFTGEVIDNPFMPICRSQTDITIEGSTEKLLSQMGGFHWMTSYGDYLQESKYALRKAGVELIEIA